MSDKFTELTSKMHNGWLRGCPAQTDNSQLLRADDGRLLLRMKLCNLSEKIITEAHFSVECYDGISDFLGLMPDVAFTGLKAYPHTDFGTDKSVWLGFAKTVDYNIIPVSFTFEDGTVWENTDKKKPVQLSPQEKVDKSSDIGAFLYEINVPTGVRVKYWADIKPEYWRCTCRQANDNESEYCSRCLAKKSWILKYFNADTIEQEKAAFDKQVEEVYLSVTTSPRPKTEEECEKKLVELMSIKGYKDTAVWITRYEDLRDKLRIKDVKRITRKDLIKWILIALGAAVIAFAITYAVLTYLASV